MKTPQVAALSLLLVILAGVTLVGAQSAPKKTTITGEVIDIASYVMQGNQGQKFAAAGTFRAQKGFPPGILTEDGTIYFVIYRNPAPASAVETANELLAPLMGKGVVAQGLVAERNGIRVFEMAIVSEM